MKPPQAPVHVSLPTPQNVMTTAAYVGQIVPTVFNAHKFPILMTLHEHVSSAKRVNTSITENAGLVLQGVHLTVLTNLSVFNAVMGSTST